MRKYERSLFRSFFFSLTPAHSGKKENEQLSGGHFVFPARCAVLICPVNPGQVLERSVPAPGGQLARRASDAMSRRGPSAPGVASTTSPEATTGRRVEWQVVRYGLSKRASMCACVYVWCVYSGACLCVVCAVYVCVYMCMCVCERASVRMAVWDACIFPFFCQCTLHATKW